MSDVNLQITARGPRAEAEAAAAAINADPRLEASAYSILEEDEARNVWRLDIYPTSDDEAEAFVGLLTARRALQVVSQPLADADWLALALSGLPPVRAAAMASTPVPVPTSSTRPNRRAFSIAS